MGAFVAYAERGPDGKLHRGASPRTGLCQFARSARRFTRSAQCLDLHTIEQTIEFLATLSNDPAPDRFKDPSQARVYVVDDDVDNCQCVQLVMEEQMIQTTGSEDPSGPEASSNWRAKITISFSRYQHAAHGWLRTLPAAPGHVASLRRHRSFSSPVWRPRREKRTTIPDERWQ